MRQVLGPLVVFLLPIADTTTVSINRILRGHSPFVGGRDHTTHHLSYLGLSDGQVALAFIGLSAVGLCLTFVMNRYVPEWRNIHTILFVSYALAVFGTLFSITRRARPNRP
jgi:UDP-GlcNAc:undecaprenyl-phosphate GlcNAc-1-phosphate transferase